MRWVTKRPWAVPHPYHIYSALMAKPPYKTPCIANPTSASPCLIAAAAACPMVVLHGARGKGLSVVMRAQLDATDQPQNSSNPRGLRVVHAQLFGEGLWCVV